MTKKAEKKAEVTRCPHCGACLECGHGGPKFVPYPVPYPVYPQPVSPYQPIYPSGPIWISPQHTSYGTVTGDPTGGTLQ